MKANIPLLAMALLAASPAWMHGQAAGAAAETAQYNTADDLWAHIQQLEKGPPEQPKTREEFLAYLRAVDGAAQDFLTRFSRDPRKWDAKLLHAQAGAVIARMDSSAPAPGDSAEAVATEIVAAVDASSAIKGNARFILLQIECAKEGATPAVQKDIETFSHDYPGDPRADSLKLFVAKKLQTSDPAKAEGMLQDLTKSSNEQVASQAEAALKMKDLMKQPLDLKYTAIDGSQVDLAKLRGKVVLVDFWATWCGPCMGEVPNVVAAYNKYHGKGFEIVGISLDKDKDAVLRITKEKGMAWPQYFDGKGWQNSISSSFGIESIPAMWLVGKDGRIASTNAREDLDAEIEKLLAE